VKELPTPDDDIVGELTDLDSVPLFELDEHDLRLSSVVATDERGVDPLVRQWQAKFNRHPCSELRTTVDHS
jgi:hypothetical protein